MAHETHSDILKRLRRAHGHLGSVIRMMEEGKGCAETAAQLQAVVNALEKAKSVFIHDHIDHCLEQMLGPLPKEARASAEEFKEITKYL